MVAKGIVRGLKSEVRAQRCRIKRAYYVPILFIHVDLWRECVYTFGVWQLTASNADTLFKDLLLSLCSSLKCGESASACKLRSICYACGAILCNVKITAVGKCIELVVGDILGEWVYFEELSYKKRVENRLLFITNVTETP